MTAQIILFQFHLLLPKVKCSVCSRIFCCPKCRQKHEQHTHNSEKLFHARNKRKCDLCSGGSSLNFILQNDLQFIWHLCEIHLPLRCRKCLTVNICSLSRFVSVSDKQILVLQRTKDGFLLLIKNIFNQQQFNSISDFIAKLACSHLNNACKLEPPQRTKIENFPHADESDANYIAAPVNRLDVEQSRHSETNTTKNTSKVPFCNKVTITTSSKCEPNISDSVISLRNYSTILHTSNHSLYPATSLSEEATALVRKTSTPMHQNILLHGSGDSHESMMPISSTACHELSIYGLNSGESDTSLVSPSSDRVKYAQSY